MSGFKRADRLSGLLQAELADLLRTSVKDPRVTSLTITGVDLAADLGHAKIYYMPLGGEGDLRAMAAGLGAATGFLRREVGRRLRLRRAPELVWQLDTTLDRAMAVTTLIEQLEIAEAGEEEE